MDTPAIKKFISANFEAVDNKYSHGIITFSCDDDTIWQMDIPRIEVNDITIMTERIKVDGIGLASFPVVTKINLGEGIIAPYKGVNFTLSDITEYKEVTIREIEKELGYKIKIKNN